MDHPENIAYRSHLDKYQSIITSDNKPYGCIALDNVNGLKMTINNEC